MTGTIKALVSCQIESCAEEITYRLDMVKLWKGEPICQDCYEGAGYSDEGTKWHELPDVSLEDLEP